MRRLPLMLLAVLSFACTSKESIDLTLPPTSTDVVGTFLLFSANGLTPPFSAFTTSTEQWFLTADQVVILADNTWGETTSYTIFLASDGSSRTQQTVVSGTYVITNGQIVFTMVTGGTATFTGSVVGDQLTLIFNARRFVYSR